MDLNDSFNNKSERTMFATLTGTNTQSTQYLELFNRLYEIAIKRDFKPPDTKHRIQSDQIRLSEWSLELNGPPIEKAIFFLAVIAPNIPSMAPIPINQTIDGPLFAVNVMNSYFVVSREGKRDITEYNDSISVERDFEEFLDRIIPNKNKNVYRDNTTDDSKEVIDRLCDICKKRPGKIEHRISPPMRIVEVCLCDNCSKNIVY